MAGNFATDLCKVLHRSVAERWLTGRSEIDEDYQVASRLRLSQLAGLRAVLQQFDTVWPLDVDAVRHREAERFSRAVKQFLEAETAIAERADFNVPSELVADEQRIRDRVLIELPDVFDDSLAVRRARGEQNALTGSLARLRAVAEKAVLAELRLRTATLDRDFPTAFVRAFEGVGFPDPWFVLFVREAKSRLSREAGFERIWNAEQLALVKAIGHASAVVLAEISERTKRIEHSQARTELVQAEQNAKLQKLIAIVETGGGFQRAAEYGISEAAVRNIVERLGGENIRPEDLLQWLDNWVQAAREQLGRRSNEGEAFEAARREAERRFKAGRLREASAAFMDELEREKRLEAERQTERRQQRIRLLEEAISFDELALNAPGVVAKLHIIADIEGIEGQDARGAWLQDNASSFYARGADKGINAALMVAITVFHVALEARTRERVPLDWAETQNGLGNALTTLGERESETERLREAVLAFRAALKERTRLRVPLDWAATQNNLGNALTTLGERETGTVRLEEAVSAYRAALEERTRERMPKDWAKTQSNLGSALMRLSERESGTASLGDGLAAFQAALKEMTRESEPLDWAKAQNNLGNALTRLAERENGIVRLNRAVSAYNEALKERTRELVPLEWAGTQNNLGNALMRLGERESGTVRLMQAVSAFEAALKERKRERVPLDWARTQNNLGNALTSLGKRESGTVRLEQAVSAFHAAMEERTRELVPLDWAKTQSNLGNTLMILGARESGTVRLEQAVSAYSAALEVMTREPEPLAWAGTRVNLSKALALLDAKKR